MRFSRTFLGLSCFSCGTAHDAASLQKRERLTIGDLVESDGQLQLVGADA